MTFVIETGAGTPNATSYASLAFADAYLTDRDREDENDWSGLADERKQEALVAGTTYLDLRWGSRIKGERYRLSIPGRKATGTLALSALPSINETVTVGAIVYRLVDTLSQENDVLRGSTATECAQNLADAITSGGASSAAYVTTVENYQVDASADSGTLTVSAQVEGASGNDIAFETDIASGATISGSGFLASGFDDGPQPLIFPRRGLYGWDGVLVVGVPWKVKAATVEYGVRSIAGALAPDLTVDERGALVQRTRSKVGPIEEEVEYAAGAIPRRFPDYPVPDRFLLEYLHSPGGTTR